MNIFGNNNRITFGSFLAYFVVSAVISPLGLVSGPIAEHFNIFITTATTAFTYLTSGIFVGALIAVFIFDYVKLKQVVIGCSLVICLSIYAMYALDSFSVFAAALALIGVSCGIELTAAAVVIAKIYEQKLGTSMQLLTDSFYSMAGVISTMFAGGLLARHVHWSSAYLLAFAASLLIAVIVISAKYPATRIQDTEPGDQYAIWDLPAGDHIIGLAMLVNLVGFVSIYSWVPNYAQASMGLSAEASSEIVSRFFPGLFVSQFIMFFLVLKFALRTLITVGAGLPDGVALDSDDVVAA
jgi:TsgA-like MFS transporter